MEQQKTNSKETSSLSQCCKGPTRCYGATRAQESTPDFKIAPHIVSSSDTLQGLAIKYGVTVEQIRRVNKLWTNDNISIYKTLNIPVKINMGCAGDTVDNRCDEVNPEDITIDLKNTKKGKCKASKVTVTTGDTGNSRDTCCEGQLVDITTDSAGANDCEVTKVTEKHGTNSKTPESLSNFLNKLDDQMKYSMEQAKQQRTTSGVALIKNLQNNIEKESRNRHKTNDSGHKSQTQYSPTQGRPERPIEMNTLDHLFEL